MSEGTNETVLVYNVPLESRAGAAVHKGHSECLMTLPERSARGVARRSASFCKRQMNKGLRGTDETNAVKAVRLA